MPQPIQQYLERAKSLDLDSFACDWVIDCDTHEEGRDACIEAVTCHLTFVPQADRFATAVALVDSWTGPLCFDPADRPNREERPAIDADRARAWPFPPVKETNNG